MIETHTDRERVSLSIPLSVFESQSSERAAKARYTKSGGEEKGAGGGGRKSERVRQVVR